MPCPCKKAGANILFLRELMFLGFGIGIGIGIESERSVGWMSDAVYVCVCCLCVRACGCSATGCRVGCHSCGEFHGELHIRMVSRFGGLSCVLYVREGAQS
jgi:hypothetical protein